MWVLCFFVDLFGALPPGPAPRRPFFFFRHLCPLFWFACSVPFPRRLLALCCLSPAVLLGFFLCFVSPTPLSRYASCLVVPSSLHARTTELQMCSGLVSSLCSRPIPSPSLGLPLGGPRPCGVNAPPSRPSSLFPLFSLSLARPLAVALLLCVLPAGLSHAGAVSRALSRASWPPPCPSSCRATWAASRDTSSGGFPRRPRRPPLHQLTDGGAGRPVRINAGLRHGGSLCKMWCILVPVLAPCIPLLPRGTIPSLLLFFPLGCLSCRAQRCSRAPCVCPLLFSAFPLPPLPVPSPRVRPLLPSSPPTRLTLTALSVQFCPPSLPLRCFHPCVPPVCSTHANLLCPYPFPWCCVAPSSCPLCCASVPYPCVLPAFPDSLPFLDAMCSWRGGGGLLADWIVALLVDGIDHGLLGSDDRDFPQAAGTSEPPMGSIVANAIIVGPVHRAGNVGARCHLWLSATVTTPRCVSPPAHLASLPGSLPPLAVLHQHTSTVPQCTCTSASCQASRSGPRCMRHPRYFPRPAAWPFCPQPSALPYSAAPAAVAEDPVPSVGIPVRVRHHHIPRCHASHPPPPAVSPPCCAHPRPSAPFLGSLCPPTPPFTISYLCRLP